MTGFSPLKGSSPDFHWNPRPSEENPKGEGDEFAKYLSPGATPPDPLGSQPSTPALNALPTAHSRLPVFEPTYPRVLEGVGGSRVPSGGRNPVPGLIGGGDGAPAHQPFPSASRRSPSYELPQWTTLPPEEAARGGSEAVAGPNRLRLKNRRPNADLSHVDRMRRAGNVEPPPPPDAFNEDGNWSQMGEVWARQFGNGARNGITKTDVAYSLVLHRETLNHNRKISPTRALALVNEILGRKPSGATLTDDQKAVIWKEKNESRSALMQMLGLGDDMKNTVGRELRAARAGTPPPRGIVVGKGQKAQFGPAGKEWIRGVWENDVPRPSAQEAVRRSSGIGANYAFNLVRDAYTQFNEESEKIRKGATPQS